MIRPLLLAAVVGSLALAPQLASAVENPVTPVMAPMIVMCHAPKTGEKGNTMMMGDKSMWMCKPVDMKKMMSGPDMTNVKTMEDANKAWKAHLQAEVMRGQS